MVRVKIWTVTSLRIEGFSGWSGLRHVLSIARVARRDVIKKGDTQSGKIAEWRQCFAQCEELEVAARKAEDFLLFGVADLPRK